VITNEPPDNKKYEKHVRTQINGRETKKEEFRKMKKKREEKKRKREREKEKQK
jgi:hypothetical protein